jgi:histidinol-phosphatase (PHP family)
MGGRFTLSDDSHGVPQVGLNYSRVLRCVEDAGITELFHLVPASEGLKPFGERSAHVSWQSVKVAELKGHSFWSR